MEQKTRRFMAVNVLYALIPILLLFVPLLIPKAEFVAYSVEYCAYMVLMECGVIVLPTLVYACLPNGKGIVRSLWLQKPDTSLLLVIPLAFCAYFAVNGATVVWMLLLQMLGMEQIEQTLAAPQNGAQLAAALAIVALIPALCEEFFFRGVLQPALHQQMKPWAAILLGGCLFGLVHGQLAALPAHVLLGIGLCLVAYWTRSIWYTVVWHLIQNGMSVLILYASDAMMQVSGADSAAMMEQQPVAMLLSAGSMMMVFGGGTALFLVLLYLTTRDQRKQIVRCAEDRPHWVVWMPLLAAMVCIVYRYVISGIAMLGGGA